MNFAADIDILYKDLKDEFSEEVVWSHDGVNKTVNVLFISIPLRRYRAIQDDKMKSGTRYIVDVLRAVFFGVKPTKGDRIKREGGEEYVVTIGTTGEAMYKLDSYGKAYECRVMRVNNPNEEV